MTEIKFWGSTYVGTAEGDHGVFTDNSNGAVFVGKIAGGSARIGVHTWTGGTTSFVECDADGQWHGRVLDCYADGDTVYRRYEHGSYKEQAALSADGTCEYNDEACAPDDPRLLALIAQVAPVEVRPAARAPHPPSPAIQTPRSRPMDLPARFAPAGARDRHGHRGAPPRRTPSLVIARHRPTTAILQSMTTQ